MSYFILMGRRIPKQAITGFRFQNETDNIRPFLSIRIRGKEEIIPLKDKREILSVKAHLCSIFSGFVKIGDWYLKMSEVKEYKPVTAEDMNPYILFKTSKFGNIKAPLKAYIGKRYFIYYISCGYNCSFHINSKLNRHGTRICYSSF